MRITARKRVKKVEKFEFFINFLLTGVFYRLLILTKFTFFYKM